MKKLVLISLLLIPICVFSTTSALFLTMPASAREAALGGAFVAFNREPDAASFNPAGMSGVDGLGVSLLYNQQLFDNIYGKATIVHPAGFGMLGVTFTFFNIPIGETFEWGEKKGSGSLSDISLGLAFQRDIMESLSIGVGAKFVSVDLGEVKGSTAAADVGLLYMINPKAISGRFNIGAGVRNLGLNLKFSEENEKLPMTIMGGIMYQPIQLLTIVGEVDKPQGYDLEYGAGMEFSLFDLLKPRVGYRYGKNINTITAGMYIGKEFGSTTLGMDYALGMDLEMTHLVQLRILRPAFWEIGEAEKIPYDGQNYTRIAVSDLKPQGVEEMLAMTVADWLRHDWAKSEVLAIMARENMEEILREQELQMTGLTDPNDAVNVGKILNVQYLVMGSLSKVGSEYYINIKVVNVETGQTEVSGEEMAGSKANLRIAARRLALKLDPGYDQEKKK